MSHRFTVLEQDQAALRKALVLGGGRDKLKVPDALKDEESNDASVLNLLAVMSVRQRFDSIGTPESLVDNGADSSELNVPDRAVRDLLCSLFEARIKYVTNAVPMAVLDRMVEAKVTPHPYDFYRIESWMNLDKRAIGSAARQWLQPARPAEDQALYVDEYDTDDEWSGVSDDNWTDLPISLAVEYVKDRRQVNAEEGRQLCVETLNDHTAANRVRLLDSLSVKLSGDDTEYLLNCLEDRAASVRTQATRLLSMIEGTEQHRDRLENARAAFKIGRKNKLIGRGIQVDISVPKAITKTRRTVWIEELFSEIDPLALCEALEIKPKDFCKGIGDPVVRRTLAVSAIAFGHDDMAVGLVRELELNERIHLVSVRSFDQLSIDQKIASWPLLLKDLKLKTIEDFHWILSSVYLALRVKPDKECFAIISRDRNWQKYLKLVKKDSAECDPEVIEIVTMLVPVDQRTQWENELSSLSPAFASRPRRLNQLCSLIELSR